MDMHLLNAEAQVAGMLPGTTVAPIRVATDTGFAREALDRLPLAQSVLLLWQQVADPAFPCLPLPFPSFAFLCLPFLA